jgi:hypothetical protein
MLDLKKLLYPILIAGLLTTAPMSVSAEGNTVSAKITNIDNNPLTNSRVLTQTGVIGDYNDNGIIDLSDFVISKQMLLHIIPQNYRATDDINGDGIVNLADFVLVKRKLLRIEGAYGPCSKVIAIKTDIKYR